jgi:DNA-binding MurR/RpiR family transcriptional regulator
VDAATVVRFAQDLNYSGFRELIKEVQRVVKAELTAAYSPALSTAPDDVGLFRSLLENERHNLTLVQAQLTDEANAILPAILNAKRIWVMGQGSTAYLAGLCASALREIGRPAVAIVPDPLEAAENLKIAGAEDLVFGFALTGMELNLADAVRFARQRGAKTIVFTASAVAGAALATTIICPGPTQTHIPSFTGLAAIIVAIVAAFTARYPDQAAAMTADFQESFRELLAHQARTITETNVDELWRQF